MSDIRPVKSTPTRPNDNPKYVHWPRMESMDVTPGKSCSNVARNCDI